MKNLTFLEMTLIEAAAMALLLVLVMPAQAEQVITDDTGLTPEVAALYERCLDESEKPVYTTPDQKEKAFDDCILKAGEK
ncbi:hypothetical protein [Thiothrix sp.]|jgi:hypothetical protein|uniref:hypothetical protein n=1 Tax=Thiothrix sp. TaxID=1032 RepID=UPI00257A6E97|nr:hypothetical protein [Thiothrix sp.]